MAKLPLLAAYPPAAWRHKLSSTEWESLQNAWATLLQAHISSPAAELTRSISEEDSSLTRFLTTFAREAASQDASHPPSPALLKAVLQLTAKSLTVKLASDLETFDHLANLAKIYPKKLAAPVLSQAFTSPHAAAIESSLTTLKKSLIVELDAGIRGDLRLAEASLVRLNPLLHASPDACVLFLAGDDFLDGLVAGYRVTNPPLRKAILATLYLCLSGLVETRPAKWSMLSDALFALAAAAEQHKKGPLNVNDSLVPELVTATPLLRVLLTRAEAEGAATPNFKKRVAALEVFRKGAMVRPKRLIRRRVDKGKSKQTSHDVDAEVHVHRMSQITQVQDLFPDLGAGFVAKCLDEYDEDVEQVVANILSESLPPHLATADRSAQLSSSHQQPPSDMAPHATPPQLPTRRNIYDDDELDRLAIDTAKLSFGKRPERTADQLLRDRSSAPGKAAILSALAAFDSDDDERDDTYDAGDVGGTVDASGAAGQEADAARDANEEALFRAFRADARVFDRDATTRRSAARAKLRDDTGMADEALEGWALMLARNAGQLRRLEAKYSAFSGQQRELARTAWTAEEGEAGDGAVPSRGGRGRGGGGRGRGGGGGGGGGGGRGRGGGNVAGPTGDKGTDNARKNKEANKGSRANHNRKAGHAKKMARGGFAG
ncbi:CUE domain protein [Cordyceps fumosorosea ARSEF 2679]|uniref:CUE domain protein n=1 Tax=Cordyceps fumosorosea (strain ARSEF 2679) TaxID=1081104 RepID=A0A167NXW2_CORFA|nr:CUE domain protein [Cordyceps fumosorosea ARSEF 2679]OAA56067.1 CUE domain protein [Cordyceps fumosorosea ARSEF 2679]